MRKQILCMVICSVFISMFSKGTAHADIVNDVADNYINEEKMSLIQEGEVVIPENDYSFEEESINSYLDTENLSDTERQLEAQEARKNDNETLNDRKQKCAKALYDAMINYQDKVNVAEYALTKAEFKETISDLVNSNPELFYIGQTYGVQSFYLTGNSGTQIVSTCMGFYECQSPVKESKIVNGVSTMVTVGYTDVDTELISEQKKLIENRKKDILAETITSEMTDACKALLIHDYLILNIKYDYAAYLENVKNGTSKYDESDYDIFGALINGQAVCQGYTLAYKYLMEEAGVSDVGFACNTNHIWNTITIDGKGYYVDCTWDDPSWDTLGNVKHKYLLKGGMDFTGHGTIVKTDIECNGTAYADYFWNDINSGIFYHNGRLYYMDSEGRLCVRDGIDNNSIVDYVDLSLKQSDNWNFVNAAKLALADEYAVYHDEKNLYAYDYKDGKSEILYSPKTEESELIYGIAARNNVLSYATRDTSELDGNIITEQTIYDYELPNDPFSVPIESVSISGDDTLYIRMADGKYIYDKSTLKVLISPSDASNQKIRSWTSSNTGVITVDLNGVVKAVSPGEATITVVTMEGPKAVKKVKVVYDGDIVVDDGAVLHYNDGVLLANQFYTENGANYYLGSDGRPVKGFNNIDGKTYYFNSYGVMLTGWQIINGSKYYFNSSGIMQKNCFLNINGNRYFLNNDGIMLTGMIMINKKVYYFDANGVMLTGFQIINGGIHYFNADGIMLTGWQVINNKTYYFNSDGVMLTGWQTIDGETKYFDENGVCLTVGWQIIDGNQYYFNMRGVPVTGWQEISNNIHYFNASGVMLTGWQKINKKTYYFDKKGVMQTGWKTIKKKKYYFDKKGVMQTGWKTIKGKKYYFTKKGVMVKGVNIIKGVSYYFAPDGHFVS